jgi:hypothetical protein
MQIDPYNYWVAVTPSDSVDLPAMTEAIWAGGNGVVAAVEQDGTVVNFHCVTGNVIPIKAKRINSTNTTASNLVALYRQ